MVCQEPLDQKALLVVMDRVDLKDIKGGQETRVCQDNADLKETKDPKVTQAAKEAMENKAQEVFLVRLGMQGNEVPEVLGAKLDPRDQSESLVLLVAEECQALMDQWDPKVNQETGVFREFRAQKASLETLVGLEPLDFKV